MSTLVGKLDRAWFQRLFRRVVPVIPRERRWTPMKFINIVSAVFIVWTLAFTYLSENWKLGFDPQVVKCLPEDFFVISRKKPTEVRAGRLYEYTAQGIGPVIADGTRLVKYVAAVAGDRVRVGEEGVFINGKRWGEINPLVLAKTGTQMATIEGEYTVQAGQVLMLGTLPRSYDGRYFGPVEVEQIIGRVYLAW